MITQLILAVGLAVSISAICSVFEAALYSVPRGHVEVLAQTGSLSGKALKKLKKNIDKPITAILTMNTIANTTGAAVAGAAAVGVFGEESLGWFSALFTMTILLFSEILPKTIGVAYARDIAGWVALPMSWLVKVLAPVVWLCQNVTRLIPRRADASAVSVDEIRAIAGLSRKAGEIDPDQEMVITNILRLEETTVRDVMTPRTVTFSLSEHLTISEAKMMLVEWSRHSRAPVFDKNPDDIVGIVHQQDIFQSIVAGNESRKLSELMMPVHFVPESAPLNQVMLQFFHRRLHLFVVVDEYGSMTGVISLEDIIEEIVGREIIDESDLASDMREFARLKRQKIKSAMTVKGEEKGKEIPPGNR